MSAKPLDAVVIGGGHNGLVCAFYLARAGKRVRVLERRDLVGGAAVTEEFHPGFRNSVASYTVSLLQPKVIRDMRLVERGLRIVERPISNFLPQEDGGYLKLGGGLARTQAEFARFSQADADALPAYYDALEGVADVLRDLALRSPPNLGEGLGTLFAAARQGGRLARLPLARQRDVLDLFTKSARTFLDGWFESEAVKAAFGFDAIVGNFASPDTPGSAYVLLHHVFGEVNGSKGAWGHAIGGMGAITQRMREGGYAPEAGAGLRRLLETVSDPKITAEAGAPTHAALVGAAMALRGDRGERLALSQTVSDGTKWLTLLILAALTLVALGLVHTEHPAAQATVLTTFSLAMVSTLGLIALHERPFDGPLAMSAEPLVIARAAVARPAP